mmetsp:Transcript_27780/g.60881  ORF Transcript_27780/g.60881 Transcript_27780/m.60881 type:complete len:126 (+) Transcript_27780:121-498(+)|eukprot:CAMPEP_0202922830 /NCGR_PEP_ID=MMETSP1392-20130828/78131_1 /ASSEMBLY_ACC=CAM_ASM_000868 /TAXON_ID=225041 /ORGANISM="Chlamydomonas chlamydogama, Strain SAG 11-48b" /LENGTH=125 /DNA_ID=CAMNT_0049616481 /DNA_START=20 /DNA_END=397 /DNA_ORIENTATION=-
MEHHHDRLAISDKPDPSNTEAAARDAEAAAQARAEGERLMQERVQNDHGDQPQVQEVIDRAAGLQAAPYFAGLPEEVKAYVSDSTVLLKQLRECYGLIGDYEVEASEQELRRKQAEEQLQRMLGK